MADAGRCIVPYRVLSRMVGTLPPFPTMATAPATKPSRTRRVKRARIPSAVLPTLPLGLDFYSGQTIDHGLQDERPIRIIASCLAQSDDNGVLSWRDVHELPEISDGGEIVGTVRVPQTPPVVAVVSTVVWKVGVGLP